MCYTLVAMGMTDVELTIKNPVNPKKQVKGKYYSR